MILKIWPISSLLLVSCAPTNQISLKNWNAESENVSSLSVLLEDEGIESSPAILNKNLLLFESDKNDNTDLWYINLDKPGGIVQLTSYEGPDRLPCAHPDGKRYCFLSDRGEKGYYLGEIGKPTAISLVEVNKPTIGSWVRADISPDGKTMLYVSGKYIWTYDFATKTKTQFVQGTEARWTPDGEKIMFRKAAKEVGEFVSTSIWIMKNDGTELTEIISGSTEYTYNGAEVSPDGSKLLYLKRKIKVAGTDVEFSEPDIWVCTIDGTDHMQITTNPLADQEALWLDNETIVFCSNRPQSGDLKERIWDIWKLTLIN